MDNEEFLDKNYVMEKGAFNASLLFLKDSIEELTPAISLLRKRLENDESLRGIIRSLDIALIYAKEAQHKIKKQTKDQLPF